MTATTTELDSPARGERVRILIGFARPHRSTLTVGLLLSLAATAMGLATPMVTKWVLDSLSSGLSLATPIALLVGLLVVGSVGRLGGTLEGTLRAVRTVTSSFLEPQSGELLLDGRPFAEIGHDRLRERFAYVEQETPIVPGSIRDNLVFSAPDATDEALDRALAAVRLDGTFDALPGGLDTSLTSTSVSGGQRQRIALARAVLRAPDVLLLDEATAQVDGLTESAIHDCIRDLAARGAVITVAHRLSTVLDADTILVMEDGAVRARGTHEELLGSDALYRDLVEALRIGVELPEQAVRGGVDVRDVVGAGTRTLAVTHHADAAAWTPALRGLLAALGVAERTF